MAYGQTDRTIDTKFGTMTVRLGVWASTEGGPKQPQAVIMSVDGGYKDGRAVGTSTVNRIPCSFHAVLTLDPARGWYVRDLYGYRTDTFLGQLTEGQRKAIIAEAAGWCEELSREPGIMREIYRNAAAYWAEQAQEKAATAEAAHLDAQEALRAAEREAALFGE